MNFWTSDEITEILLELDHMQFPFPKYTFCQDEGKLRLLGRGGSADVYEVQTRASGNKTFAMKVIGFRKKDMDSEFFQESVQVQESLGNTQTTVVKVYDYTELWVTLDEKDHVIEAVKEKPETTSERTVKLQFIVMEKIPAVITRTKSGNIKMLPESLARGDEQEILKLAYDVGHALEAAHNRMVLHRDVKLENIFYSEKTKSYKLGDFGIAKKTEDGFAGTIAFTKGYKAPEVRVSDERYDKTADIYSFGMMLYVLANGLKFPDSNTYNVNVTMQYQPGYVVPYPEHDISEEFDNIIVKACMYDPDQRYQSMEEMLLDIESLLSGERIRYKKEHKNGAWILGSILLIFGIIAWKVTINPEMSVHLSVWDYILLAACIGKGVKKVSKKNAIGLTLLILVIGIFRLISSGFAWIKLLVLFLMIVSSGTVSEYLALGILTANVVSFIQVETPAVLSMHYYSWIPLTLISISVILLYQYETITSSGRKTAKFANRLVMIALIIGGAALLLVGHTSGPIDMTFAIRFPRSRIGYLYRLVYKFLYPYNCKMIGGCILGFLLFLFIREKVLLFWKKEQKMYEEDVAFYGNAFYDDDFYSNDFYDENFYDDNFDEDERYEDYDKFQPEESNDEAHHV